MTYLITFSCYGARLHGDETGSVDRQHNLPGTPLLDPDPLRSQTERATLTSEPYLLDKIRRPLVLRALTEVSVRRKWTLLAAHVRTNHVHAVVEAPESPEEVMHALKSFASRMLNQSGLDLPSRRRWSRHGSTRWLWKRKNVEAAIAYVAGEQGEPMELYVNENR